MKNRILFPIIALLMLAYPSGSQVLGQPGARQDSTVTLFSGIKHRDKGPGTCFNFPGNPTRPKCDLRYGGLYVRDGLDWFESSTAQGNRSVIMDLGAHEWNAKFKVPVVEPLARLKPGEQRVVFVNADGADGADGKGARPAPRGSPEDVWSRVLPERHPPEPDNSVPQPQTEAAPAASRPKRDGRTRTSSQYVKAIAGHVYVIHVVDDDNDFYALFRLETLERGDNCTISWRLIPAPVSLASQKK